MGVSRRRLLAALLAGGGVSTVGRGGALTTNGLPAEDSLLHASGAWLRDVEGVQSDLTAGLVDLAVAYWVLSGPGSDGTFTLDDPDGVIDGPVIQLPIGTLDETEPSGSTLFRVALPDRDGQRNNPAQLWLQFGTVEPAGTALADTLQLTLSYAESDGTPTSVIADGTLSAVAQSLQSPAPIDGDGDPANGDDCLVDQVFLLVEYDLDGYVGSESVTLPLSLGAVQCRNGGAQTVPFSITGGTGGSQ
jgi:hypothetical protein